MPARETRFDPAHTMLTLEQLTYLGPVTAEDVWSRDLS